MQGYTHRLKYRQSETIDVSAHEPRRIPSEKWFFGNDWFTAIVKWALVT
jgi:hypothetical protein